MKLLELCELCVFRGTFFCQVYYMIRGKKIDRSIIRCKELLRVLLESVRSQGKLLVKVKKEEGRKIDEERLDLIENNSIKSLVRYSYSLIDTMARRCDPIFIEDRTTATMGTRETEEGRTSN